MADDYRQRVAEAIAAKFTYPVYHCDRDGENERVENAEPADRIDQTPYVMVAAGDGCRSFWTPTCVELANVVADVRDQDAETLRAENEELRKRTVAEIRTRPCGGCFVCAGRIVAPMEDLTCESPIPIDEHGRDQPAAVTVLWADLDLVMNGAGRPSSWETYVDACQRIRDALGGQHG